MKNFLKFFATAMLIAIAASTQAATLTIIDGQLHGATGVSVDGQLYDVAFIDDTAENIWGPLYNYTFTTRDDAEAASAALFSEVFIDSALGEFDTHADLTNGIELPAVGSALTPWLSYGTDGNDIACSYAVNWSNVSGDEILRGSWFADANLDAQDNMTWARWSPALPVPVPGTLLLLGSGCLALAGYRRKNKS